MLFACWSVKGGSGTTVVAAALALLLADSSPNGVMLVDLGGDVHTALGVKIDHGPGLADWLNTAELSADALGRLAVDAAPGVDLIPWRGGLAPPSGDAARLLEVLAHDRRTVVVDCGSSGTALGLDVAASASVSLLVMRPCFLSLRRALDAPIRPSGVILVNEPGRSLESEDIADVLGVPIRAEVAWDVTVARAVDAGLLIGRLPRALSKPLRAAA